VAVQQAPGEAPVTVNAGDVFFVPAETVHTAKNVGSGNAAELATYVVEKGKPFLVVVDEAAREALARGTET
jgi:quercetin dioxygenase-like cupin family protein